MINWRQKSLRRRSSRSHQPAHLWREERHRVCEVWSQWEADGVREADQRGRHSRQAAQRHRRRHALAIQHGNPDDPLGGVAGGGAAGLHVGGDLPLPLVPAVLEPDLHLGLGELQRGGQPGSLRAAQVALHVEGGLQLEDLTPAEHGARLLLPRHFDVNWKEERCSFNGALWRHFLYCYVVVINTKFTL